MTTDQPWPASDAAGLGQWSAWVEAGKTREERHQRLARVPAQYRAQVASHVRTCAELKRASNLRGSGLG